MMDCSVVVATFNRGSVLQTTLERLCSLPQRPPIIVVDNASQDETPQLLRSYGDRVAAIRLNRNIGAAARTFGAQAAMTPLIAFC
ncbi:MAG: glycosyltransferase family 2 protein, partial [Candidatus Eremiobacteraeota bacterium]|nr:glycosyltransferase family 2 protein [Candidatus Eremiobacteraeota bacterium]